MSKRQDDAIGRLLARLAVASALAFIPLLALDQVVQPLAPLTEVAIRFVGAALVFTAAIALTERFGPFRRKEGDDR